MPVDSADQDSARLRGNQPHSDAFPVSDGPRSKRVAAEKILRQRQFEGAIGLGLQFNGAEQNLNRSLVSAETGEETHQAYQFCQHNIEGETRVQLGLSRVAPAPPESRKSHLD